MASPTAEKTPRSKETYSELVARQEKEKPAVRNPIPAQIVKEEMQEKENTTDNFLSLRNAVEEVFKVANRFERLSDNKAMTPEDLATIAVIHRNLQDFVFDLLIREHSELENVFEE